MKGLCCFWISLLCVVAAPLTARAALLMSEGFEGPCTMRWYHYSGTWNLIPDFVGKDFSGASGPCDCEAVVMEGNKYSNLFKDSDIKHSGKNSIRLFSPRPGGTSHFHSRHLSPSVDELWITWWERLKDYNVAIGNKWFSIWMDEVNGKSSYLLWQSWDSPPPTGNTTLFAGRWYATPGTPIAPSAATFAPTKTVSLPLEQWYQWKIHVKLNTVGSSNGVFMVAIKKNSLWEVVWDLHDVEFIANHQAGMSYLRFSGTRTTDEPVQSSGEKWIDDILVGTTESDVDADSAPANAQPVR